jgi:hypothetical protein
MRGRARRGVLARARLRRPVVDVPPRCLLTRRPSRVETSARNPSHLTSNVELFPVGIGPERESMGVGSTRGTLAGRGPSGTLMRPTLAWSAEASDDVCGCRFLLDVLRCVSGFGFGSE